MAIETHEWQISFQLFYIQPFMSVQIYSVQITFKIYNTNERKKWIEKEDRKI